MKYTKKQFRTTMTAYLNEHWSEIKAERDVATVMGYSERYFNMRFKEVFGCSFLLYLKQYKLHRAAMSIVENKKLTNIGKTMGYANPQSFSKAFRKEFGLSPKQFLESDADVPDMPVCCKINGEDITVEYAWVEKTILQGKLVKPIDEHEHGLIEERGCFINYLDNPIDFEEEKLGMWYHDEQCEMFYFIGHEKKDTKECPKGYIKVIMPKEYYAVLSVRLNDTSISSVHDTIKQLSEYAYREWAVLNQKNVKKMGFSYEKYEKDKISLYIPVYKRGFQDSIMINQQGTRAWFEYIDKHIEKDLTIEFVAEHFNYSRSHFIETFKMYFGIAPGLYIKRRRLSLTANELRRGKQNEDAIVRKYGFSSYYAFKNQFVSEFKCDPEKDGYSEYKAENLQQYYDNHKESIQISLVEVADVNLIGRKAAVEEAGGMSPGDLIEYIALCFKYNIDAKMELRKTKWPKNKIIVWQTVKETAEPVCIIGSESDRKEKVPEDYFQVKIKGGRYVVIESHKKSDRENLTDMYRMLYRCSFDGWVQENRVRVDFRRLTYVKYENEKLYFYIPVNV